MIALTIVSGFLLIGAVFMFVELYKAPFGVEDENGFTVLEQEGAKAVASVPTARAMRNKRSSNRLALEHMAEVHDGGFPSHAR